MTHSAQFANHFARLTSMLVRQSDEVEEQKTQLMSAVASANALPALIIRDGDTLLADGGAMSNSTIYTLVLLDRMKRHGLVRLEVMPAPSPADVLSLARILAAEPEADGTSNIQQRLAAIRTTSLRVEVAPVRTPTSVPVVEGQRVSLETFEVVSEEEMRASIAVARPRTGSFPATPSTPSGMFAEFSGPKAGVAPEQLLKALEDATDIGAIENIMTALPPHISAALDAGRNDVAVAIAHGVARRESRTDDPVAKKLIGQALRRMVTPALLRATIQQLAGSGDRLPDFVAVFAHGGDGAVEMLADRLAESDQAKERRAVFNALVQLKSGVPMFIHMLGDRRWFVVRNAADLLAQIGAPEAEEPLIRALDNADPRARRSVVTALGRYATPKAQGSVRRALKDAAPEVRVAAAGSVGRAKSPEMVTALIELLAREEDLDVQKAALGALGRQGTDEAVRRLADAARAELFKRKPPELRVAAVRALRDAGTPTALQAVRSFVEDKDPAIREAATKSLK